MAYARKTTEKQGSNEWKKVEGMAGFSVIGTRDRFSLNLDLGGNLRIGMNGCRIVAGRNGDFISFPAWKDKKGEYHDYCYYTFTPEEVKMIVDTLA